MAFEALANVLSQIGRDYAARKDHDRDRAERLADIASQRQYEDEVRQKQFDQALALEQKRQDIALKSELERVQKLPAAQLLGEAEAAGVPTKNIDGTPRSIDEVRAAYRQRKESESAQAALAAARASAAAAADPQVIASNAAAQKGQAEATLNNEIALSDLKKKAQDTDNKTWVAATQPQLDAINAQLKPYLDVINSNPALTEAARAVADIKDKVAAAAKNVGTPQQLQDFLGKKGIGPDVMAAAYSGDPVALEQMAHALSVQVDPKSSASMAAAAANQQAYVAVQMAQPLLTARNTIMHEARQRNATLNFGDAPAATSTVSPSAPAAGVAQPGVKLPTPGAAPVTITRAPMGPSDYFAPEPAPAASAPAMQPAPGFSSNLATFMSPADQQQNWLERNGVLNHAGSQALEGTARWIGNAALSPLRATKRFVAPASDPSSYWYSPTQ